MSNPSFLNVPYRFKAGTLYSQIPESGLGDLVVTRTTSPTNNLSTRVNAQGFIETVADNVPRLDYPLGGIANGCPALLVEPAATNQIRNNTMVGAVAGTPGTLPTGGGWSSILIGLTQTIVGVGAENGISYIDIKFSGTATSTSALEIRYESLTQINALSGQAWTHSVYLKKIADPNPPANYRLNIYERTSGGSYVANGDLAIVPTTTIQRFTQTRTLSGGGTVAKVQPTLLCGVVNGSTYDFTLRIGLPQMELGSVATSVIPTTTQAITRGAEAVSKTGVSSLIGQTEGTIYAEVDVRNRLNGTAVLTLAKDAGVSSRVIIYTNTSNRWRANYTDASGTIVDTSAANDSQVLGVNKLAFAYGAGGNATVHCNGSLIITLSGTSTFVQDLQAIFLGSSNGGALFFNNRILAAELYPTRLTNAQLQSLTQ
jgi:hypothetical protein